MGNYLPTIQYRNKDLLMAEKQINNFEGNELADDYARTNLPQSRWGDAWDTFKTNFINLILLNLLTLLFFIPSIVVLILRTMSITSMGTVFPFTGNLGMGYPGVADAAGMAESVVLTADMTFYGILIATGLIAAVGISGCAYSVKRTLNTKQPFKIKSFFHGVKLSYLSVAVATVLFLTVLFLAVLVNDWSALAIATGASKAGAIIAKICMWIATAFSGMLTLWYIAITTSYKVKGWSLIKSTFVLFSASIIQSVFFTAFALLPLWLFLLNGFWRSLSLTFIIFIGFMYVFFVWMAFTQYIFDMFITPNIKSSQKQTQQAKPAQKTEEEKQEEQRQVALQLLAAGKSELIGKPIKPLGDEALPILPTSFSREQLAQTAQRRQEVLDSAVAYEQEHINDSEYVAYQKMFADRDKALATPNKKKKTKLDKNNLLG